MDKLELILISFAESILQGTDASILLTSRQHEEITTAETRVREWALKQVPEKFELKKGEVDWLAKKMWNDCIDQFHKNIRRSDG